MRRMAAVWIALLIVATACSAVADSWVDTFAGMSDTELLAAYDEMQNEMKERGLPLSRAGSGTIVWVSKSGSKYHRRSTCGGRDIPMWINLSQAKKGGYEPCKLCGAP